ncbi:hybrid sensor histidine kinase/response regulator [Solilutibacter pythonis]|nr:hybrid sensor histidine kinase/response regulator [Lysobacter pythonis]
MRKIIAGFIACLAWMAMAPAAAKVPESPHLRVLGSRDGVPSTQLNVIDVDRAGFVWIGSLDGLARYDGNGFRIWRHDPRDSRSLPGNIVQAVHVDARDRVWVATEFSGLSMLGPGRSGFTTVRRESHPMLGSNDIYSIASHGDTLWFGTANAGLYQLDAHGDDPEKWRLRQLPGLSTQPVLSLAKDAKGRLWIGSLDGLSMWDGQRMVAQPLPGETVPGIVYSLLAEGGRLWVGSAGGVFRREADGRWLRLPWADMFERPNAVVAMVRDHEGVMWLGSQRRLWRVRDDESIPLPVNLLKDSFMRPFMALRLQPDGGLWVGIPGVGLGYLRSDWRGIAELSHSTSGPGLAGESYRAVTPARDGGVWVAGTDGHVERVDGQGVAESLLDRIDKATYERELQKAKPSGFLEDARGQLWLGDGRGILLRIDRAGRIDHWHRRSPVAPVPQGGAIDMICAGPGDTLWLSVQGGGLQQRDIVSGRVLRNVPIGSDSGLGDGDNEALRLDREGRLWIAGGFGLGWLDEATGRVVTPPGLAGNRVFGFDFDGPDSLWLHRLDGLEQYRRIGGQWRRVARVLAGRDLPALEAAGLRVDDRRRVWLTSQRGLFLWDPARRRLRSYGIANGLSSQEFAKRALAFSPDGMLAAPTSVGSVVLVDTRYPDPPAHPVTLRIDGIDVRQAGRWVSRVDDGNLTFAPDDREIRLTGHLLAFDDPGAIRYRSRLDGFERDWVEQGALGERIFTGLGPGRYVLHMRASDADGNVADEQRLEFTVTPPWWRAPPAMLAYLLALLAAVLLGSRSWRQRLRRRNEWRLAEQQRELAEQASEAKTRFLATLGHEIRTPMTGVLGMAELLQSSPMDARQRGQVDAIHRAGRHLLRLVNDALDLARIEADKLELSEADFDFRQLIDDVTGLMRPMAERKGLGFRRVLDAATPRGLHGDRTRVEQILLNLLGNAIKFTERGEVRLSLSALSPQGVVIEISDTGPGLDDEQRQRLFRRFEQAEGARTSTRYGGSGLGLAISQELAAMMGGRIDVDSAPGQGARFRVELPLVAARDTRAAKTAAVAGGRLRPLSLLLVEDDATVADVVGGLLRAQGHAVSHAAHGLAALSQAATTRFDVALLDLDLPGMDGFELARQLRAQGHVMPLLAVTARADAEAEPLAVEAGFDGFVRKPVTSEMLAEALEKVLAA